MKACWARIYTTDLINRKGQNMQTHVAGLSKKGRVMSNYIIATLYFAIAVVHVLIGTGH